VFTLTNEANFLKMGGDFTKVAGTSQQGFAIFPQ
jgi:hypothetical protein